MALKIQIDTRDESDQNLRELPLCAPWTRIRPIANLEARLVSNWAVNVSLSRLPVHYPVTAGTGVLSFQSLKGRDPSGQIKRPPPLFRRPGSVY